LTIGPVTDSLLTGPEFPLNPYPVYARLHRHAPVYWNAELGYWFVSGYNEVKAALSDPVHFSNGGWDQLYLAQLPAYTKGVLPAIDRHFAQDSMISADPPAHTRLRRLVHRAFTPAAVRQVEKYIESRVEALLGSRAEKGSVDVLKELAVPLPIGVFAHMFGMPESDHELLKTTSADFTRFVSNVRADWQQAEQANRSLTIFQSRLLDLIRQRRREPKGDLLTTIVSSDERGDSLTEDELLPLCTHMLIAGHETTTNLIANGVLALLSHPQQMEMLRANQALLPAAVEEILRWETPLQRVKRMASADIDLGGRQVHKGDRLMILVGAANRDTGVFQDPEQFDISAARQPHLAFGYGIHFCVGAALARIEGALALNAMITTFPEMHLAADAQPRWNPSLLRGLSELVVYV
jgi:pimeloyl-[acyl-carrier protein] synthase